MHIGRKVERIRELKNMKQETLASIVGYSQQTISRLEQSEKIEDEKLQKIADALGTSVEGIKKFNEEGAINIISSSLHDSAGSFNTNPVFNFNPVDKLVELYERLLKEKDETIEMFKQQQKN